MKRGRDYERAASCALVAQVTLDHGTRTSAAGALRPSLGIDEIDLSNPCDCREYGRRIGRTEGCNMTHLLRRLWQHDDGQDIAEYAVMLAVILVLVVGTIRLVGSNADNAFSNVASSIQ